MQAKAVSKAANFPKKKLAKAGVLVDFIRRDWINGNMMFTGTYTAIVTPFKNGKIDEPALERLIKAQIRGGVDGIVPVGTTGESPTLNYEEHIQVIAQSVKFSAGRI